MKITQMTSVQQKAIPHVMMGTDTLVQSQTGSGTYIVLVYTLQSLTVHAFEDFLQYSQC